MPRAQRIARLTAATIASIAGLAAAQPLPPNFADQAVVTNWNLAVGVTFAPDGRAFVWEKGGKVWLVENGIKSAQPLIDISEEVGNWGDYGLLGFAIDPNFSKNGYIYLLYAVDYHHARYFGTPQYDPGADEYYHDTIGRITRYTCNAGTGFRTVNYASRSVLVGESLSTGFPLTYDSHGVGTLMFGEDGSLLASCGDGASYHFVHVGGNAPGSSNTALADGIITQAEDVGSYRSQLVNSLCGKVIRIDPGTGNGLPSNPFYSGAAPRSPRSRVWSLGLRNPYSMCLRPGTGTPPPTSGDPGSLYILDVGWNSFEKLTVATGAGQNHGWPAFEGFDIHQDYWDQSPRNRDAPNPLGGGQCNQYFKFTDLIIPPTLATPSWPNPCNTGQQVPSSIPRFVCTPPVLEWGHGHPVRVGTWQGTQLVPVEITDPQSPVPGMQFGGSAGTAVAWYPGGNFPALYNGTLFMADFTGKNIINLVFNAQDQLTQVRPFASDRGSITSLAVNPADQSLYYILYEESGACQLRKIRWYSNLPPVAAASANPAYGPTPLTVSFSSAGSSDPEGRPLTYLWDFGDGSPRSTLPNPTHLYHPVEDITAQGTIVARIFSMNPPTPTGEGNRDPEVIRDGVYPPLASSNSQAQYDTQHNGDQGNDDWIGYTFASPRQMRYLTFQEGMEFGDLGGWFDVINVEYRSGLSWIPVNGLHIDPAYAGHDVLNFNTYKLGFDPVTATGIRVRGQPGGTFTFFSVGELRVLATPVNPGTPMTPSTATLTVSDELNTTAQASVLISPNNTPPQVTITSPLNNAIYTVGPALNAQLRANVSDAETPGQLSCRWQAIFHHDTHTHAEPPIFACAADTSVQSGGCDAVYFWEFRLTVTDPQGLATTRAVFMYPDCCYANCDGSTGTPRLTANDFLCFLNAYAAGNEQYVNCDGSTGNPLITANDFQCFINKFAAGCS